LTAPPTGSNDDDKDGETRLCGGKSDDDGDDGDDSGDDDGTETLQL
jgi:hypothetical protein